MPSVFDRLSNKLPDPDKEPGLSPVDIAHLPKHQKSIMRLMIREYELTIIELKKSVGKFREDRKMSEDEMMVALDALETERWLLKVGEETIMYRANMKRKAGSKMDLWADLNGRIKAQKMNPPDDKK